jgi:cob(I)alamin adenosyltransferase
VLVLHADHDTEGVLHNSFGPGTVGRWLDSRLTSPDCAHRGYIYAPMPRESIYTRSGDDGTTGLFYGGRVAKDSALPVAYGTVDEAQAAIGLARAHAGLRHELDDVLISIERDLYVAMAELATAPDNRAKLVDGRTRVTAEMVDALETLIDSFSERFEPPTEFVVPGQTIVAAHLDVARTVVRRAERVSLDAAPSPSLVIPYLNRLSDLLWTLARWHEGHSLAARAEHDKEQP